MKRIFGLLHQRFVLTSLLAMTLLFAILAAGGALLVQAQAQRDAVQCIRLDIALAGGMAEGKPVGALSILTGETDESDYAAGVRLLSQSGYVGSDLKAYPYYDAIVRQSVLRFLAGAAVGWLIACAVMLVSLLRLTKHWDKMTHTALAISRGEPVAISAGKPYEGAGMEHALIAVVGRLQYHTDALQKDKLYLKDFLSDISHQLKTPLTTIRMVDELLLDGAAISPEQKDALLKQSLGQLDRIDWLVQGLLRMAKLEAGAGRMQLQNTPLAETVREALSSFWEPARQKRVALSAELPGNPTFPHDGGWVAEAIGNLVKNALEHTPPGGHILLHAVCTPLTVQLTVEDDGDGMDAAQIPHLFERFSHDGGVGTANVGIGLALARSILEQNHAEITVSSAPGKGSRFTITFLVQPSR